MINHGNLIETKVSKASIFLPFFEMGRHRDLDIEVLDPCENKVSPIFVFFP